MADDKKNEDYTIEMGEQKANGAFDAAPAPRAPAPAPVSSVNSPVIAILSYCGSSILMTTTNKYVLSGLDFNLNFFLLAVQVWRDVLDSFLVHSNTDMRNRVSCVLLLSRLASPLVSSHTETSTATKLRNVRPSNLQQDPQHPS